MSRLPFEFFLALRYLRPKRTFVSVITVISVVGVILGVAVLIIVISVMTGFDRQLRERILGFTAHLHVTQRDALMTNYPAVMQQVNNRQELVAHDRALLLEALGQLYGDAPLDPARDAQLRERLAAALGRDAELDALLEAGEPLGSAAVLRAVTRAAVRLEPGEAQRIVIGR